VVAGAGFVWLASHARGVVSRIDPVRNRVVGRLAVAPGTQYLAFGEGALWAVSSRHRLLQKIDPASGRVLARTALGRQPGFLAAGEGAVWVQEQGDGTVARIDPVSGRITGRVKVGDTLKWGDIDTGGGRVWLRTTKAQTLVVIDAATLAIRARLGRPTGSGAVRYTPAGIWTSAHDVQAIAWWPDPARIGS
jgi:streptogramin lyase